MTRTNWEEKLNAAITLQNTSYAVIVDGNRHHLPMPVRTEKREIGIEECRDIVADIKAKFNIEIDKIEIWMDEFDYSNVTAEEYSYICHGDATLKKVKSEKIIYITKSDTMTIWRDGEPVYENASGTICDDIVAMLDWYC